MRRVLVLALIGALTPLLAAATADAAHGGDDGPRLTTRRYVPTPLPTRWFVDQATVPTNQRGGEDFTFYADPDDPTTGPALAVGTADGEDFVFLRDASPRSVPGIPDGRLARNGRYVWLTWSGEGEDVLEMVAARDLDDRAVIEAARSVHGTTLGAAGIPAGLQQLVSADVTPDFSAPAQRIVLVDASGMRRVRLEVFAGSSALRAMQQFWIEQEDRRESQGSETRAAALGPQRDVVVVARGNAPATELRRLAASMRATGDAGWATFRDRVADLPVTALFPGSASGGGVVLDGFTEGARWAIGFPTDGLLSHATIVTADQMIGAGANGVPSGQLPPVLSAGSFTTNGGAMLAGVVPAAAASAQFLRDGQAPLDAVLGPTTPDGTHRYLAAWVPEPVGVVGLVVDDASGAVIARRQNFGCNTCAD